MIWSTPALTACASTTSAPNPFRPGSGSRYSNQGKQAALSRVFHQEPARTVQSGYYFGQEATALFELMAEQITLALRHDCIRHALPCVQCEERGQGATINFMQRFAFPAEDAGN